MWWPNIGAPFPELASLPDYETGLTSAACK